MSDLSQALLADLLKRLETLVNLDSGTYNKVGVDQVGEQMHQLFERAGFHTELDSQTDYGNNLIAHRDGTWAEGPRLLLIGHMDTVFGDGEAQKRPFKILKRDGRRIATGPGILDMKSGLLIGLSALELLIERGQDAYQRVTFLCNSDEEIGSPGSKPLVERLAKEVDAVLVLEPGREPEAVVSRRRGVGKYKLEVHGIAAHAGADPWNGRNAILELTYHIQRLQALNDTIPRITLNTGIVGGGERSNIVPDYAWCEIDIRAESRAAMRQLEDAMRNAISQPVLEGTRISLNGAAWHQPFEETHNGQLVALAREAGHALGVKIEARGNGGGSDGNTSAGLSIPTLDGLGAAGAHAHNPDEYIDLDSLPIRISLLAGLVQRIIMYYQQGKRL